MAATFIWNLLLANFGLSSDTSTTVNPIPKDLKSFKTQGTDTSELEEWENIIASPAKNTATSASRFPLRSKTYTKPKAVLEARSPKLRRGAHKDYRSIPGPSPNRTGACMSILCQPFWVVGL
ncbi:hypothetical protein C8Q75DRAFT_770452 [Abortiporus biennis]|nr:hypothetical protein C8Q75DRAFT_770452 [Abortiporus biennis]